MKKNIIGFVIILMILSCSSIISKQKTYNKTIAVSNYIREIFCGDKVLWQFHFGEGYKDNKIAILHKKDTLCLLENVNVGVNECTSTYVSVYDKGEYLNLYYQNNQKLDSITKIKFIMNDSLKVELIIDDKLFRFEENIKKGKFFIINFSGFFNHNQSKNCIGCE